MNEELSTPGFVYKKDPASKKTLFDHFAPTFAVIAKRYAKSDEQGKATFNEAMTYAFRQLDDTRSHSGDVSKLFEQAFITGCVNHIKGIRHEYYVSSTVNAARQSPEYDLFRGNKQTDFNAVDTEVLIKSIQDLSPAQRLIFNLHVIDGYAIEDAAALLETSVDTVRSNLEKARYNLQKNITVNAAASTEN